MWFASSAADHHEAEVGEAMGMLERARRLASAQKPAMQGAAG
jgi:hypothetical protein